MLTTATIAMSLTTDSTKARLAPAEQSETADTSFAKSFDESSEVAAEMLSQASDKNLKGSVELDSNVSGKERESIAAVINMKMKQDLNAGDEILNAPTAATSRPTLPNQKLTPSTTVGVTIPSTEGTLQHGQRSGKNTPPAIQNEMPGSPISSENVNGLDLKNLSFAVDDTKTDATNRAAGLRVDGTASQVSAISGEQVAPVIQNLKEVPTLDKEQEGGLTKRGAKDHGDSVKAEKSAKAEDEKPVSGGAQMAPVRAQTVVAAPIIVLSFDGQQHGLSPAPEEAASSPVVSPALVGSVGSTMTKTGVREKSAESTKKGNNDDAKTSGTVAVDDSASRKITTEESKTVSAIKATDRDKAAMQSTPEPINGPAHAELMTGVNLGGVSGEVAAHVTATKTVPTTETSLHAPPSQAGPSAIDGATSTDPTQKTLMATPTSLEIGVVNGTHGWLKIRADMTDGGVVNASLSTATSSGQEMLHRELPSLAAYLESERVAVNAVTIQPSPIPGADFRGFDGGMSGDGRGLAQQSGSQGGENRQGGAGSARIEKEEFYSGVTGVGRDELLPLASRADGGNWLNVRA